MMVKLFAITAGFALERRIEVGKSESKTANYVIYLIADATSVTSGCESRMNVYGVPVEWHLIVLLRKTLVSMVPQSLHHCVFM